MNSNKTPHFRGSMQKDELYNILSTQFKDLLYDNMVLIVSSQISSSSCLHIFQWFPWWWLYRYLRATNHESARRAEGSGRLESGRAEANRTWRHTRLPELTVDEAPAMWGQRGCSSRENTNPSKAANKAIGKMRKGNIKWTLKWPSVAGM